MPEFRRGDALIYYTDTGAPAERPDAPVVFFGHGLLFGGWMFRPQIEALRGEYRCVAIDWRGQGQSPPAKDGYDMETLAADAMALIVELGLAPVHYVGLSMGGFVGQRIAARNGHLVRSLTLLDTSAGPEDPGKARQYKLLAAIYRMAGITPLRPKVLPLMFGPAFLADPASAPLIEEWEQRLGRCPRAGVAKAVRGVANRASVEPEVTAITVPTLVIVGADDAATPPAKSRRIAELIPGARWEQVPDCGHSSTLEQPAAMTRLISEFLRT
ncbi:alpha/beta fold hydrolase [Mycolicibacterium sp.]|uniref:alpha/beta fold hydrolase n=1 Tax=Mycolicibacterium sp. TaxID=2320850 RepID=UPI0028AF6F88|nr:alpha/beta fold hydrolase [Mycolicibacterium sp.]